MIGKITINYSNQDIIELVKADILKKFGTRDLEGINLANPNLYTTTAKVESEVDFLPAEIRLTVDTSKG